MKEIISKYGEIKNEQQKFATIFFFSYELNAHQIKVEINNRKTDASLEMRSYFGIPVLVSKKDSILKDLGELINEKQEEFVRTKIKADVIFLLKSRLWVELRK